MTYHLYLRLNLWIEISLLFTCVEMIAEYSYCIGIYIRILRKVLVNKLADKRSFQEHVFRLKKNCTLPSNK